MYTEKKNSSILRMFKILQCPLFITLSLMFIICSLLYFIPDLSGDDLVEREVDNKVIESVKSGLEYLVSKQNTNGSWTCAVGHKFNEDYRTSGEYDHVGVTPLACLALMADGNLPGRGKYAKNVENGLNFVISCQRKEDGYITLNGTRMYEFGFCVLFLSEIYGMTKRSDIGSVLRNAVGILISSQNSNGGWRYQPNPQDADISVTVTILQALRAAKNAGVNVESRVIDRAVKYVKQSANVDGSFNYQLTPYTRSTYSLTAAGITSLISAGLYDTKEVKKGIEYLKRNRQELIWGRYHYFYGHYYAVQAFWAYGGNDWKDYYNQIKAELLKFQRPDGSWIDDVGSTYATSMACLILSVPYRYLPIFKARD